MVVAPAHHLPARRELASGLHAILGHAGRGNDEVEQLQHRHRGLGDVVGEAVHDDLALVEEVGV